jgi:formylglycine-generating enzyme required for sulfatase activity
VTLRAAAVLLACALAGCQPTSQLVLHVDTDAVVPPRQGAPPDPSRPPWLFDRLRVELFDTDAPVGARDFAVDQGLFEDGLVSIGVAPPVGDLRLTARVRLFRGDHAFGGQPWPNATLDSTYALPPLDPTGVQDVTARLHTDDVGRAIGPIAPDDGAPGPSQVGSWPGAAVVPCGGAPGPEEACVPGGAYWMGDPILEGLETGEDANQERLVVISPFYVDLHEVTVADVRAHLPMLAAGTEPDYWDGSTDPTQFDTWCTYTPVPLPQDPSDARVQLPVNCVSYERALAYCVVLGKTLPSEAQYEFLASGRGAERAYPWGDDEPTCPDAVWGMGGIGLIRDFDSECRTDASPFAGRPPGSTVRDHLALAGPIAGETRDVVDLAGNLAEWVRDGYLDQTDPFWSAPGVRHDPVNEVTWKPGSELDRAARGGDYYDVQAQLRAAARRYLLDRDASGGLYKSYSTGFRCVRPG